MAGEMKTEEEVVVVEEEEKALNLETDRAPHSDGQPATMTTDPN